MSDELQSVADNLTAKVQEVMAELERLSEIADSQRQAGDVSDLVETQDAIIRLDIELLSCTQQIGEMQYEALQRAVAQRDAARAEVAKLQAEVAKLRAWMPKWRRSDGGDGWELGFSADPSKRRLGGSVTFRDLRYDEQWIWHDGRYSEFHPTRESAMRAAEAEFGLPECEVVE